MKHSLSQISLYVATCGVVASLLMLGGCATSSRPASAVSQKPAVSPMANYAPYYSQNPTPPPVQAHPPISAFPGTTSTSPAAIAPQGKVKVAILLPLTGKNAALGQAMLNAAQQAVFDAAGTNFELQPHDTAAAGGAEAAARAAVTGGVQLIIGPLFATDVPSVTAVARNAGLQLLTLSTDTSLAERGVYVMGLAPGAQVERVTAYAAARGVRRFAALVPATPYGSLVGQVFQSAVAQNNGSIVDYETYDPATAQGADRAKQLAAQHNAIDALFLPEAGADLKTIADQLAAAGFDAHTHILGTGLWDAADTGHQSPLLIGAWYAAPDPAARRTFAASYSAAYGQEPPRLATLAYDATALAAVIAKHGAHYDDAALSNPNGFAGLDGIFRLDVSGSVERALAVNEVTPDGAHVIDSAPTSFVARVR
jgi:ABC-type branched-subunit amino acid transport system substrate-binding protein